MNWESASEITEGVAGWVFWIDEGRVNGVSAWGDGSWLWFFVERFAVTLSLLVEMAFGGGNGRLQVAAKDLGCKIGPSGEEIAFRGLEESADTWTEGGCMEPSDEVSLCLFGEQGVGLWLVGREG